MMEIAISNVVTNAKYDISINVLKWIDDNSQINPTVSSIRGYEIEIFLLQLAHFPACSKNDTIGIFLYRGIVFLHEVQNERGVIIDNFFGIL